MDTMTGAGARHLLDAQVAQTDLEAARFTAGKVGVTLRARIAGDRLLVDCLQVAEEHPLGLELLHEVAEVLAFICGIHVLHLEYAA